MPQNVAVYRRHQTGTKVVLRSGLRPEVHQHIQKQKQVRAEIKVRLLNKCFGNVCIYIAGVFLSDARTQSEQPLPLMETLAQAGFEPVTVSYRTVFFRQEKL